MLQVRLKVSYRRGNCLLKRSSWRNIHSRWVINCLVWHLSRNSKLNPSGCLLSKKINLPAFSSELFHFLLFNYFLSERAAIENWSLTRLYIYSNSCNQISSQKLWRYLSMFYQVIICLQTDPLTLSYWLEKFQSDHCNKSHKKITQTIK